MGCRKRQSGWRRGGESASCPGLPQPVGASYSCQGLIRVNKQKVVLAIIEKLRGDLALYHKAAGAARAEATHEQSRAEHKYDTRGLEASYLARGQSRHAAEID